MPTKQKDRKFFEALAKLNSYIEANIKAEGFLPSESKMCELFEVSRVTYRSAVASFRDNGFIVSYPKKGHYVLPRHYRVKKVGVVLVKGRESPFIQLGRILGAMIDSLETSGIYVQIIQSSLPENLRWRAMAHGVRSLVWMYPSADIRQMIDQSAGELPYSELVIDIRQPELKSRPNSAPPTIAIDNNDSTERKVRYIFNRGHSKVAFIAPHDEECQRLRRIVSEVRGDLKNIHIFTGPEDWLDDTILLAQQQAISAVVTSGNLQDQERFIQRLDALGLAESIEVFLPNEHLLDYFKQQYPKVRVVGFSFVDWKKLGETAAELLSANILSGTPIQSRLVRCHQVTSST